MSTQGAKANLTGNILEKFVQQRLIDGGYKFIDKKIMRVYNGSERVFTRQYNIGNGIYNTAVRCDIYIYNPELYPKSLAVECKWQQSSGSVDEKFPYLVLNIKSMYEVDTIIILDGEGYKKGAEIWLREQIGGNLLHVFNMREFTTWCNNGHI